MFLLGFQSLIRVSMTAGRPTSPRLSSAEGCDAHHVFRPNWVGHRADRRREDERYVTKAICTLSGSHQGVIIERERGKEEEEEEEEEKEEEGGRGRGRRRRRRKGKRKKKRGGRGERERC